MGDRCAVTVGDVRAFGLKGLDQQFGRGHRRDDGLEQLSCRIPNNGVGPVSKVCMILEVVDEDHGVDHGSPRSVQGVGEGQRPLSHSARSFFT